MKWERRKISPKLLVHLRMMVDDWFGYNEKAEEGSGFGLNPLITLHYHTVSIYHQTPKASVQGELWNQSHRVHAIYLVPQKAALFWGYHILLHSRGNHSKAKMGSKLNDIMLSFILLSSRLFLGQSRPIIFNWDLHFAHLVWFLFTKYFWHQIHLAKLEK